MKEVLYPALRNQSIGRAHLVWLLSYLKAYFKLCLLSPASMDKHSAIVHLLRFVLDHPFSRLSFTFVMTLVTISLHFSNRILSCTMDLLKFNDVGDPHIHPILEVLARFLHEMPVIAQSTLLLAASSWFPPEKKCLESQCKFILILCQRFLKTHFVVAAS